jgi:hypothetical protein
VDPRAGLDAVEKTEISVPHKNRTQIYSLFTDLFRNSHTFSLFPNYLFSIIYNKNGECKSTEPLSSFDSNLARYGLGN